MKKTVLVTGVTGDIGTAIALEFARQGWHVIGHYHSSQEKAQKLKSVVDKFDVDCSLVKTNFLAKTQLTRFIHNLKRYEIDSLINNAGGYVEKKYFTQLSTKNLMDTFMMNTFAPILITAALFSSMQKRKYGRVVNISSIAAKYGGSLYSMHYGCSKRAVEGLTRTLAREGAKDNVLVNTLRPGVIDTQLHQKFPKDMKERMALIPMRKMGKAQDVARMAFYLGSDQNEFITNEVITVAGGE